MKRNVKKSCLIVLLMLSLFGAFSLPASATDDGTVYGTESLSEGAVGALDDFRDILPGGYEDLAEPFESADSIGFERLFSIIADGVSGRRGELVSFLLLVIGCAILISLSASLGGEYSSLCRGAVGVICSVCIFSRLFPIVDEVARTVGEINGFFGALIPLMATVNTLGGNVTAASSQALGMTLTMQLYGSLGSSLTLIIGAMFAVGMLSTLGGGFAAVGRGVRGLFGRGMGIFTALLAGTLSLQTLLTGVSDSTAMRVARYAISGTVPIVGGAVSSALSTLAGGLSYAKGVIGGGAVAVLVLMAAVPLVILLLYKLCFFLAITFLDFTSGGEGGECLVAISGGLDALISVYTMTSVIYIFQVILFIMGGIALE